MPGCTGLFGEGGLSSLVRTQPASGASGPPLGRNRIRSVLHQTGVQRSAFYRAALAAVRRSGRAGPLALVSAALAGGCADDDRPYVVLIVQQAPATGEYQNESTSTPRPSSDGSTASACAGPGPCECLAEDCPGGEFLGVSMAGCCAEDGACGVLFSALGTSLCVPAGLGLPAATTGPESPGGDRLGAASGGLVGSPRSEEVVIDPACPGRSVLGVELAGCCDPTGVCGVSTRPLASGGALALPGLDVPLTCLTAAEVEASASPWLTPAGGTPPLGCGPPGQQATGGSPSGAGPSSGDGGTSGVGPGDGPAAGGGGLDEALWAAIFDLLREYLGALPADPGGSFDGGAPDAGAPDAGTFDAADASLGVAPGGR